MPGSLCRPACSRDTKAGTMVGSCLPLWLLFREPPTTQMAPWRAFIANRLRLGIAVGVYRVRRPYAGPGLTPGRLMAEMHILPPSGRPSPARLTDIYYINIKEGRAQATQQQHGSSPRNETKARIGPRGSARAGASARGGQHGRPARYGHRPLTAVASSLIHDAFKCSPTSAAAAGVRRLLSTRRA